MRKFLVIAPLLTLASGGAAKSWWDEGHMQIAYVTYQNLDNAIKDRVDVLLRLNIDYDKWTSGAPDASTAKLYAFVHAATWPDDIKTKAYGYTRDDPHGAAAGQNVGYSDRNQHAYWYFKDTNFSPDGTALPASDPVDAVTQMRVMIAVLPATSGATDDLRSYDLIWMLHLAGDLHQPLHAVARYTQAIPHGDAGGNAEMVIRANGETVSLHAYWDSIFGGYSSPYGAVLDASQRGGVAEIVPDATASGILDPQVWADESAALAQQYAYASPVGTGLGAVELTRTYETAARNVARAQAALAARRLANVLNAALR